MAASAAAIDYYQESLCCILQAGQCLVLVRGGGWECILSSQTRCVSGLQCLRLDQALS